MQKLAPRFAALGFTFVCLTGCGSTTPPKSTTTSHTQSTTTTDTGDKATIDTREVKTEQADGSQTVERTQTTSTTVPAPTPTPAP